MKEHAQFSRTEIEDTIAQLESIMVNIKRQSTDQPEAIKQTFPTLSSNRINQLLSEPLDAEEMITRTKQLIQFFIGKTY
ncbi:hypothetical protein WJR50_00925 [Catalinimonas sp. 4WD22]|uniref:hypothetical protein n=1 Tax=Catalinimonas locisalis TaxID=3133978 RepID=UPI003101287B